MKITKTTKKDKQTDLDKRINEVLEYMKNISPESTDYTVITENLERLYKAKASENDRKISSDTIAVVAGNLLGIVIILGYEKANVITSKAFSLILKGRV